jgi:hypothetical protein
MMSSVMTVAKLALLPSRVMLNMIYDREPTTLEAEAEIEAQVLAASAYLPSRAAVLELERRIDCLDQQLDELLAAQEVREALAPKQERAVEFAPKQAAPKSKRVAEATPEAPARLREREAERKETAEKRARVIEAEPAPMPIRGYDGLRVPEIVEQLPALGEDELRVVREYEASHANHRGVIEAIDEELARRQPLSDYASLSAPEIIEQLETLDVDQARSVWSYEDSHARRVTVMRAAEKRIAELLPIQDYPGLPVVQVVARLAALNDEALGKVRRYEEAHADRVGVLRAIDEELARRMPLSGYSEMTVADVMERLEMLDGEKLREVRAYEEMHANRVTLLREIDERLARMEEGREGAWVEV